MPQHILEREFMILFPKIYSSKFDYFSLPFLQSYGDDRFLYRSFAKSKWNEKKKLKIIL